MTIVPQPLQKGFRRLEIVFGLVCVVASGWLFYCFGLWAFDAPAGTAIDSPAGAAMVLFYAVYLLVFGGNLLHTGYVALIFWAIALAAVVTAGTLLGPADIPPPVVAR